MKKFHSGIAIAIVFLVSTVSFAGVPLTNPEGVGGIAFNPLAYTAGTEIKKVDGSDGGAFLNIFNKPQFGFWYVNLGDVSVDWTAIGVGESLLNKRLEVTYGYETIAQSGVPTINKHNLGTKILLLQENSKDLKFVPAVSVGSIWKQTSGALLGVSSDGFDFYIVATKLITGLPKPVLLSGGILSTEGYVTGIFGFDKDRDQIVFWNADLLLSPNVVAGFEYKNGARFNSLKNADYWNAHAAWFVNSNLTLVAAYVNAGDYKSAKEVGLGNGVVLSVQYAF